MKNQVPISQCSKYQTSIFVYNVPGRYDTSNVEILVARAKTAYLTENLNGCISKSIHLNVYYQKANISPKCSSTVYLILSCIAESVNAIMDTFCCKMSKIKKILKKAFSFGFKKSCGQVLSALIFFPQARHILCQYINNFAALCLHCFYILNI